MFSVGRFVSAEIRVWRGPRRLLHVAETALLVPSFGSPLQPLLSAAATVRHHG